MNLKRLNVNRLPGIDSPFQVEFKGSNFHIIHGPNGIGKSSLCKAVEHLYWGDQKTNTPISVAGQLEINGVIWSIERDGKSLNWSRIDGQESEPPELPPSHQAKCFFLQLRDLINPSRDSLFDIATEINKQMAGGFDLDSVTKSFPELTRHRTSSLSKTYSNASLNTEKKQREQSNLQSRENQLEELEARLAKARENANQEASINKAVGLVTKRKELNRLYLDFQNFPSEIGKIQGDEIERLNELEEKLRNNSEEIELLNQEIKTAKDEQKETKLSEPLDSESLTAQKSRADQLIRLEDTINNLENDIADQKGQRNKAMEAIGKTLNLDRQYQLQDHSNLYEFLGRCLRTNNQEEIITKKIEFIKKEQENQNTEWNSDQLDSAISALRMWLRAPSSQKSSFLNTNLKWTTVLGVFLVLLGGSFTYVFSSLFLLLVGTGLGILIVALYLFRVAIRSSTSHESREEAKKTYRLTKLDEPDQWDIPSVKTLLTKLEKEQANVSATHQVMQIQRFELEKLNQELETVKTKQEKLDLERKILEAELDLDDIPDTELVDYARSLDHVRGVQISLAGFQERLEKSKCSHNRELKQVTDYITRNGGEKPDNGLEAKAKINSLSDRSNRLNQALLKERSASQQIKRIQSEKQQTEKHCRVIFLHLSLDIGDRVKLKEMLDQKEGYSQLRDQVLKLESQIEGIAQELDTDGESELKNSTIENLHQQQKQAEQAKQKVENISAEISEIQTLVNQAKQGDSMQDLIAKRDEARNNLQDGLETQLHSHAVKFLIDQVKDQYEQGRIPRMFERAKSHFARFTRNSYELQLGRHNGKPGLWMLELHTGKKRELDQLSDGTRVQLLIATRIAFAEEIEKSLTLPFFLDEALDQSDPQRFAAIVNCLGQVSADQKRQIIYLTSDPVDQDRIKHALESAGCQLACTIDLGRIRNLSVGVDDITKLEIQSETDIPAPSDQSYSQYSIDLAISEFTPTQGWLGQSISYVLPENNELLYKFYKNGIQFAGQWSIVQGQPLANELCNGLLDPEEMDSRIELFKIFCELWSLGRGRPLDRHNLETSDAISDRYIQGISEITKENKGNAAKLIEILKERKDERSSGFRQKQINKLEQYFLNNGYLEDREVLDKDQLLLRIRATPIANKLSEHTSLNLIKKWQTLADQFSSS
ncbi:MAG: AAA family ATPase [Gammaproteobacteria bacterium]|nr:AAA family ATPase [Gammaproteobacteria bacterium]